MYALKKTPRSYIYTKYARQHLQIIRLRFWAWANLLIFSSFRPDIDWPVSDEDGECRYEKKNAGDAETQSKEQTRLYPLKKTTFYKKC